MRIAVIGAGLVGVATVLELTQAGHEVHAFDRHSSAAAGASFAAPGLLTPIAPYLLQASRWRWTEWTTRLREWPHRHTLQRLDTDARDQALAQLHAQGSTRLTQLRRHFRQALELRHGWSILIPSPRDTLAAQNEQACWQALGIAHQWLDADGTRRQEPGLAQELPLHGALHLPQVAVVNLRQLAQQIKQLAEDAGAQFHFQTQVTALTPERPLRLTWQVTPASAPLAGALPTAAPARQTDSHQECFDAAVLCGGPGCSALLSDLGLNYPLRTIAGCSVTAQLQLPEAAPDLGPHSAVTDTLSRVTMIRLGDRVRLHRSNIRASGPAGIHPKDLDLLHRTMDRWFPHVRRSATTPAWQGSCSVLPDGAPLIGPSRLPGIWLNLAHGEWGAGLALGAAGRVCDQITHRSADHQPAPWHPGRWN